MGADLYRDDHQARRDALRAQGAPFEEMYRHPWYFRDSYNRSNLLWKLDMSWWQDLPRYLGPDGDGTLLTATEDWTDANGVTYTEEYDACDLYPVGARAFADDIAKRAELLAYNIRDLPNDAGPDGDLDRRYFLDKFDRLLEFLRTAADEGRTIRCSV